MADTLMADVSHKDELPCSVLSPPASDALKDGSDSELSELDEPEEINPSEPTTIKKETAIKLESPARSNRSHMKEEPQEEKITTTSPVRDSTEKDSTKVNDNDEDKSIATPAYYDGTVPVFRPDMEHFEDFTSYMNSVNSYGMQSGIIKIIPPAEWKGTLPRYDDLIKPIKVKDAIRQEILGTTGRFRQLNHVSQRSYNIPQWKALCEQSDHQPPAKRGERRANQRSNNRQGARSTTKPQPKAAKKTTRRQSRKNADDDNDERLPTPGDSDEEKAATNTSVSARRKFNRKEAATRIDHEVFVDFDYELKEEFSQERCDELERAYWKTLTYASPLYGADHVGTLFDERTKIWNLDKLPNMLDVLGEKIPGVNTAYLYMGMWKATFAWHLEDVDLYSINYLHFGAPKQWYSISQKDARKFEEAMASHWPDDAKACDQFLRHKTFLISPSTLLEKHGIKVNKITHHPGEFIVTYPYGYHSGYNLGYNCAEAVNFALDSWLPYGRIAKKCDCSEAQDSVFIDVAHLERKLNGEPTPDPTDDEFDDSSEDEDEQADILTPPESGGEIKIRIRNPNSKPKRKRAVKGDATAQQSVKKIRLNMPRADSCALCPHHIPHEKLIKTPRGKTVHRKCAELIPEVTIETEGGVEVALGIEDIPKARADLKCVYCSQRKGACFQCTFGKCSRSFHGVCAMPAGVHIDEGEIPVYGDDGTEYKTFVQEPRCRFHREKRDKKVTMEDLENDPLIRRAAHNVMPGATVQFQYMGDNYMAGLVVDNDKSQACMTLDILPYADHRIILDYKWLRFPAASDCRLAKPSAKAIPLPKKSLNTSKRMANDLPRKGDSFGDGFKWEEFNSMTDAVHNANQVKVDFSKDNQLWHYLGKTSTEAKAQYTEDPKVMRHNVLANYMDTIPKPILVAPQKSNVSMLKAKQNALNNASSKPDGSANNRLVAAADVTNKRDRPYIYTPRTEMGGSSSSYAIDQQAYKNQQQFLQSSQNANQRPTLSFGSDPMKYNQTTIRPEAAPRTNATTIPQQYNKSNVEGYTNRQTPSVPAAANRPSLSIFNKYPYLQKEHNKSPLDYKSPYRQGGGFLNGYQGNLQEHLKRNPAALMSAHGGAGQRDYATILPPLPRTLPQPAQPYGNQARQSNYTDQWNTKPPADLHPAIRSHLQAYPHTREQSYAPPAGQSVQSSSTSHMPLAPYPGASSYSAAPTAQMTGSHISDRRPAEYPPILPPRYQSSGPASVSHPRPAAYASASQEYGPRSSVHMPPPQPLASSNTNYPHNAYPAPPSGSSLSAYATSSPKPAYSSWAPQQQYSSSALSRGSAQYTSYEQSHSAQNPNMYGPPGHGQPSYHRQETLPPMLAHQPYTSNAQALHGGSMQRESNDTPQARTPDSHFVDLNFPNSMGMVQQILTDLKKVATRQPK